MTLGIWLSGGLHHDGLMDTADGLAAGAERRLQAMDDSRVGASGVLALAMVMLIELAAMAELVPRVPMALLLSAFWARGVSALGHGPLPLPAWIRARRAFIAAIAGRAGMPCRCSSVFRCSPCRLGLGARWSGGGMVARRRGFGGAFVATPATAMRLCGGHPGAVRPRDGGASALPEHKGIPAGRKIRVNALRLHIEFQPAPLSVLPVHGRGPDPSPCPVCLGLPLHARLC